VGDIAVKASGFGSNDLDLGVYVRNPDGTVGYPIDAPDQPGAGGNTAGQAEEFPIENPTGPANQYYVVLVPYTATPGTTYNGSAEFDLKAAKPSLKALNRKLGPGPKNHRASHDKFISHSEPSIAMDPNNHNHLIAGSKMYERLPQYLFKAGTYESTNGGRSWHDQGQLPGYCQAAGQCDPNDEERYRTVSDISLAFDDEGNAYANVLDAPGGTLAFTGFNMTVNIKKKGQSKFGNPIVVHDNQKNALTQQLLLDDKNWIAVDNHTDVNGGPNKPNDGKIGTIYVCWGLDSSTTVPGQQIVLMRSLDGGKTWGGVAPGDNTPQQLSQKTVVSGIGCQEAIGPNGEVYVTWYDNQLDQIMQVKSTDQGKTFTPARPIANIVGVNDPFPGQQFRNLSIPSSGVDSKGNVYVVSSSRDGGGSPVVEGALEGQNPKHPEIRDPRDEAAEGQTTAKPGSGSDIVMFKSTDGGLSYTGPVRVNQDQKKGDSDQFQPWLAVTPKGQVDVSYFDRRDDHNGLFINTYLSRSTDGGKTFRDTRVTHKAWDPRVNPPTSASGEFIGDYQGLVADDDVAIPFWNDTQAANLPKSSKGYSPWQEVYSARIPNVAGCTDRLAPKTSLPRKNVRVKNRRVSFHGTAKDRGCGGKIARVTVSIGRLVKKGKRCRFLRKDGTFTKTRACKRRVLLRAKGRRHWKFHAKRKLPKGRYRITAAARDVAGHLEKPVFGRNTVKFRVR
ncbi:MAG: hypothetical protein QOG86_575, partial [Thermoleophilaceae bacterium]|nr:hypothetical protein [Thermoleophilaceae bacterium]